MKTKQRHTSPAQQAVRIHRFMLALSAYGIGVLLVVIAHILGISALAPLIATIGAMAAANGAVYVALRTNLNERFADPSLTWVQVLAGTAILMYVVYHFDHDRGLALMASLLVLAFGAFRFTTREFLTAAGVVLAGHAAVINLLFWMKPGAVDVWLEAFQWITLAFVLPCFAVIGGRGGRLPPG